MAITLKTEFTHVHHSDGPPIGGGLVTDAGYRWVGFQINTFVRTFNNCSHSEEGIGLKFLPDKHTYQKINSLQFELIESKKKNCRLLFLEKNNSDQ